MKQNIQEKQQINNQRKDQNQKDNQHWHQDQAEEQSQMQIKFKNGNELGKAVFTSKAKNQINVFQGKYETLSSDYWQVSNNAYQSQNWKIVFQQMISCTTHKIRLIDNKYPSVIKQIIHIDFQNLLDIVLFGNNITNIQAVCWLKCEKLKLLSLSYNKIVRIGSLSKWSKIHTSSLFLNNNLILQMQSLAKMKMSNQFQDLTLEVQPNDQIICQDFSNVFKAETQLMGIFCHSHQTRLQSAKIQQMLLLRFPEIKFFQENQD